MINVPTPKKETLSKGELERSGRVLARKAFLACKSKFDFQFLQKLVLTIVEQQK